MRNFFAWAVWGLFLVTGCYVGRLLQVHLLPNMGANYITPGDVFSCYLGSILVFVFVGAAVAIKIQNQ